MLKHFSNQTRAGRRQRRARQAALKGALSAAIRALGAAKAALPGGLRKSGPWAVSAAANTVLFAALFLYGVPRFVADSTDAIQVTVTSFFADTEAAPEKPGENGGGGGQEALEAAAASYQVAPATEATMSLAAVTTSNPSALRIEIPQASKSEAKLAPVSAIAKAAPAAGSGGGTGGGKGGGVGNGEGKGSGPLPKGYTQIGSMAVDSIRLLVIIGKEARAPFEYANRARLAATGGGQILENGTRFSTSYKWWEFNSVSMYDMDSIEAAVEAYKPRGIFWLGLFGGAYTEAVARLRDLVLKNGIKLYVSGWGFDITEEASMQSLIALCHESGGDFEQCVPRRPAKTTIRLTQKAWERYRRVLLTPVKWLSARSGYDPLPNDGTRDEVQAHNGETIVSDDGQGRVWSVEVWPISPDKIRNGAQKPETWIKMRCRVQNSTTDLIFRKEDIEPESWDDIVVAMEKYWAPDNQWEAVMPKIKTRMTNTVDKTLPDAENPKPESEAQSQADGGDQKQASR